MAVLELQQVKCPNCGANITSFNAFKAEVECPYCHQKAFNPLIVSKQVPIPERVIVFKTNESNFEQSMINSLIETDYVPTDIFSVINPGNIIKAYLPMYLYEGVFQASWSCMVGTQETEMRASSDGKSVKNKTVIKYRPSNGNSSGNFAFLCLAYEGEDVPKELQQFTSTFPYDPFDSKEYDPDLLGLEADSSIQTLAMNADSDIVWNKYGSGLVDNIAESSASKQAAGDYIKDFRVSSNYNLSSKGRYIMAPFWFVYYNYKESKFYYIMDGIGSHDSVSTPVDQEQVAVVNKYKSIKKWVGLAWILAFAIGFTPLGWTVAFIYAICAFIARITTNIIMNKKIKTYLDGKREERRAAAGKM